MNLPLLSRLSVSLFLGLVGCRKSPVETAERAVRVDLIAPQPQSSYEVREFALGKVEAARHSNLGFEIPGTLVEVLREEGDAVARGDALARLDTARLEASLREAGASVTQAEALLALAEANLKRNESARGSGAISAQQLDQAIQQRDTAAASVRRARAEVDRVQVDLGKSVLRAPYDGIIARRSQDPGSAVAAGQAVLHLLESHQLEIRAGLPDHAVGEVGEQVELHRHGRPIGSATVQRILPTLNASVRTVDVILEPDDDLPDLRDGDLVEIAVTREIREEGFWLPFSALGESHRGLWAGYIASHDAEGSLRVERLNVEILHLEDERAFVRAPLPKQAQVIAQGLHRLVPGQKIEAANDPELHTASTS